MKKYIMALLLATGTLSAAAQDLKVKSMVVYKTDGTRDTIMLKPSDSYFYGKENPEDGDYINGGLWSYTYSDAKSCRITYQHNLTGIGKSTPYTAYGYMLSSNPITTAPDFSSSTYKGYTLTDLYFVDKDTWYEPKDRSYSSDIYMYNNSFWENLGLTPGVTYYGRAYMMLDDKVYYGTEYSFRAPKHRRIIWNLWYPDYTGINDSVIMATVDEGFDPLYNTVASKKIAENYIASVLRNLPSEELLGMATKTEDCDDGTLYVIEQVSDEIVNQARAMMEQEAMQEFFVEASRDNVITGNSSTTFGSYKCDPIIMECSDAIGVRDNKCFYTDVTSQSSSATPQLAIDLNHLMLPGQEYEVSFTFVPGMTKADTLATYFQVYIADGQGNGMVEDTFPALGNAYTSVYGNDTIVNKRKCFQASATEPTTITLRYTPTRLTFCHALQLQHVVIFNTSKNRKTYGQRFCISGISVKPVKD